MKRLLAVLMAFTMVFALGVTAEAAPSDKVEITWGDWMLSEDAYVDIYSAMVNNFMAQNDEVNVATYTNPYSSYLDQLLVASAAGNGPDVAHIKAEWLPQFLALDCVQDIYAYVDPEVLADFSEESLKGVTIDGKLIGLPWFNNAYAMFYNKDLLEKAGITELPKSMTELVEDAKKISALGTDENGNKLYGIGLANSSMEASEGYNMFPILWGYGGEFVDDDGNITLTSDAAIKSFSVIQDLFVNEITPAGSSFKDIRNLFGQGVIGFYWDGEAGLSPCAAAAPDADAFYAKVGAMPIPAEDNPCGYGYLSERYMIVFKSCPEEKLPAVADFIEYMSGADAIRVLYDANQGKMSSRASVMADVYGNVESEITRAFVEATSTARSLPSGNLAFLDADQAITDAVSLLAQGQDVNQVMADAQKTIQELYDEAG